MGCLGPKKFENHCPIVPAGMQKQALERPAKLDETIKIVTCSKIWSQAVLKLSQSGDDIVRFYITLETYRNLWSLAWKAGLQKKKKIQ